MNHRTIQLVLCALSAQCDVVKCFILRKTGAILLSQHNTFESLSSELCLFNNGGTFRRQRNRLVVVGKHWLESIIMTKNDFVTFFKDKDQVCDHSMSVSVFKVTFVHQNSNKKTRQSQSTTSLQLNGVRLAAVCHKLAIMKLLQSRYINIHVNQKFTLHS